MNLQDAKVRQYLNLDTGQVADELPKIRVVPDAWREVVEVETAIDRYRVTALKAVELDGKTCKIAIIGQVNIALEQAQKEADAIAQAEAQAAWIAEIKRREADTSTWSKREQFLLDKIQKIAPFDFAKDWESFGK